MISAKCLFLAAGVFTGNWLLCPLLIKETTSREGFFAGLIAALLVVVGGIVGLV